MSILRDGIDRSGARTFTAVVTTMDREYDSSSSSSFLCKYSDEEGGESEGQSRYKGPLEMGSLEEVLPIRRSISNFYKGKSRSFTSLTEAKDLQMKDLGRRDNRYDRRRRNLLCHRILRGGISKKPVKSAFTLPLTDMSRREQDSSSSVDDPPPRNHQMHLSPVVPEAEERIFHP